MLNLTRTADFLARSLQEMGFLILSEGGGKGLPLVAFRLDPEKDLHFDEFAVAHHLRERGWIVPAYTMAPHSESLKLMRVVVREDFSRARCDALLVDMKQSLQTLTEMDGRAVANHMKHVNKHATNSGRSSHNQTPQQKHYKKEKHSLQGKTGKTHPVC